MNEKKKVCSASLAGMLTNSFRKFVQSSPTN